MTHGTGPATHADPRRARGCGVCLGWGTLVGVHGRLLLCGNCQLPRQRSGTAEAPSLPHTGGPPPRRAARYASAAPAVRAARACD